MWEGPVDHYLHRCPSLRFYPGLAACCSSLRTPEWRLAGFASQLYVFCTLLRVNLLVVKKFAQEAVKTVIVVMWQANTPVDPVLAHDTALYTLFVLFSPIIDVMDICSVIFFTTRLHFLSVCSSVFFHLMMLSFICSFRNKNEPAAIYPPSGYSPPRNKEAHVMMRPP
jgi:hypothetical protein